MANETFPQHKLDQLEAKTRKLVDAYKSLNVKLKAAYSENYNLKMTLDKKK